jgi:hypothetical protein
MRNVSDESCSENQNTHFILAIVSPSTKCVSSANAVCRNSDIFNANYISLTKYIYLLPIYYLTHNVRSLQTVAIYIFLNMLINYNFILVCVPVHTGT